MKTVSKTGFVLGGLMVFSLALVIANRSWAEEDKPVEAKVITLESQMSQLIDSQNKLTETLQQVLLPKDKFKNPDPEPQQAGGDGTNSPPAQLCIADYLEWPSSTIFKDSDPWAIEDFYSQSGYGNGNNFQDINGDGLVDYFYMDHSGDSFISTCVQLNNGHGWDLVHKCFAQKVNNKWTFYGDCAKI